jgi:hypothetical protein
VQHIYIFHVSWKGKVIALHMSIRSKDDDTYSPVTIKSDAQGADDELVTYQAKVEWQKDGTGKLTADVEGHGSVKRELPPRTVVDFSVFDLVQRQPFKKDAPFKFHQLEATELQLKKDHQLLYKGPETLDIDGKKMRLHRFEHTGGGISPCQYWVDHDHRLVRVLMDGRKEFLLSDEATARAGFGTGKDTEKP